MNFNNKNQQMPPLPPSNNKSSTTVGVIVVLFGIFLLMKNLSIGVFLPSWLFGWQMILIIIGLVIGVNSKFKKKSAIILIGIGSFFLLREWMGYSAMKVLFPIAAIAVGIYIINRNRKQQDVPLPPIPPTPTHPTDEFDWDRRVAEMPVNEQTESPIEAEQTSQTQTHTQTAQENTNPEPSYESMYRSENVLKVDAIFGNVHKIILSKNFLGGNITTIFGTTEINLLQADLRQPVVIDTFQLFGSTKIVVPPHWTVTQDVSSILGDNDDRRVIINHPYDEQRKLYITGTSIFGTLTIKNT